MAGMAQLGGQWFCKPPIGGSSPPASSAKPGIYFRITRWLLLMRSPGLVG